MTFGVFMLFNPYTQIPSRPTLTLVTLRLETKNTNTAQVSNEIELLANL